MLVNDELCLCSFAHTRRAEEYDSHAILIGVDPATVDMKEETQSGFSSHPPTGRASIALSRDRFAQAAVVSLFLVFSFVTISIRATFVPFSHHP
jgi:hypothetical protein